MLLRQKSLSHQLYLPDSPHHIYHIQLLQELPSCLMEQKVTLVVFFASVPVYISAAEAPGHVLHDQLVVIDESLSANHGDNDLLDCF